MGQIFIVWGRHGGGGGGGGDCLIILRLSKSVQRLKASVLNAILRCGGSFTLILFIPLNLAGTSSSFR